MAGNTSSSLTAAHLLYAKSPVTNIDFCVFIFRVPQNNIWLRFSGVLLVIQFRSEVFQLTLSDLLPP